VRGVGAIGAAGEVVAEEVMVVAGKGAEYDSGSGEREGEGEGAVLRGGGFGAALLPFLASFLFFKFLFFSSGYRLCVAASHDC